MFYYSAQKFWCYVLQYNSFTNDIMFISVVLYGLQVESSPYGAGRFNNMLPLFGKYATLGALLTLSAISSAASILRSSIKPSPASLNDCAISDAARASPSAETMAASFCCSAYSRRNTQLIVRGHIFRRYDFQVGGGGVGWYFGKILLSSKRIRGILIILSAES